ncbi:FKBP-type peptidyl-prolyl cis-trans isomerase [Pleomorphovibrio marinus]|uniref:FKBP-type peptidyl-prolyl cis-trans isomerase n=1 Tax=Pleomorphovibrio marinus TaxID=2164132 RepID=UPI000E0B4644|nr:FKBP-type peptidyl-prolyl cis-trans isomerase [Pleomorphovibrio marinus]
MKKHVWQLFVLFGLVAALASCISDDENVEANFERERQTIQEFVQSYDEEYIRRVDVGETGVVLLFLEESEEGLRPDNFNTDTLYVDYIGSLLDGTVFDTSIESVAEENDIHNPNREYGPFRVSPEQGVIQGWYAALSEMKEGDKVLAVIPSIYAYGNQSPSPLIPPNTILKFEMDLVRVAKPEVDE